jgi:hypothetical protein
VVKLTEVKVPSFGDGVRHRSWVEWFEVASLEKVLIDFGKRCS